MCGDNKESTILRADDLPLQVNETWYAAAEEVLEYNIAKIFCLVRNAADTDNVVQNGVLYMDFSPDGEHWSGTSYSLTDQNKSGIIYLQPICARWMRLRFVAGATACRIYISTIYTDKLTSAGTALSA